MNNANLIYKITAEIIVFEYGLVALLLIIVVLVRVRIYINKIVGQMYAKKIEYQLRKCMLEKKNISLELFNPKWLDLRTLLEINKKIELEPLQDWQQIKNEYLLKILLPVARIEAYNNNVLIRIYATEVFCAYSEASDEDIILTFLKDKSQLVRNSGALAAIKHSFKKPIFEFIDQIAETRWFYRNTLAYYFHNAPEASRLIVIEKLNLCVDPYARATCYNILTQLPPSPITIELNVDLTSTNIELRIAVIKFIAHNIQQAAIPILSNLLDDPEPQVQAICIHKLTELHATDTIDSIIKFLNSTSWFVRLSAARALITLCKDGKTILAAKAPDIEVSLAEMPHLEYMLW